MVDQVHNGLVNFINSFMRIVFLVLLFSSPFSVACEDYRDQDISDIEVKAIVSILSLTSQDKRAYIGPVIEGCRCQEPDRCIAQVNVLQVGHQHMTNLIFLDGRWQLSDWGSLKSRVATAQKQVQHAKSNNEPERVVRRLTEEWASLRDEGLIRLDQCRIH